MTTLRQIEANRRNALLSTGPKTEEGRNSSKRNSFEHGMAGEGAVRTEDERRLIEEREKQWRAHYRPADPEAEWAVREAALMSVRLQRCATHDWSLRMLTAERAETTWNDDRRLAAEELGARLAASPAPVSRRLRRTLQGCEWLLLRWEGLAAILRAGGDWNEAQEALALGLLGIPHELRDGLTPIHPARVEGDALRAERLALAEAEIAELEGLRAESLVGRDEVEQVAAASGFPTELDREVRLLMRYEAASIRRMTRALDILRRGKTQGDAAAAPTAVAATPLPERQPQIRPEPAPSSMEPGLPATPFSLLSALDPESDLSLDLDDTTSPLPSNIPAPARPDLMVSRALGPAQGVSSGNRRERRARKSRNRRRSGQ